MAAPTFVGAGTGLVQTSGNLNLQKTGHTLGNIIIAQVFVDGTGTLPTVGGLTANVMDLAGTADTATLVAAADVGSPLVGRQLIYICRADHATAAPGVSFINVTDDAYGRLYEFSGVNTGATLAAVVESIANGVGTGTTVSDTGVTTLGADRLALQFVAANDDVAIGPFTGATGGAWSEPVAEFASATGTDGCIQLQTAELGGLNYMGGLVGTFLFFGGAAPADTALAVSFTGQFTGTVPTVSLRLAAGGVTADDVIVEIRSDSGGLPSATVIGTAATLDVVGASATYTATVNAPITVGTTYWIAVRRSGAAGAPSYSWEAISIGTGTNTALRSSSGVWSTSSTDLAFAVVGSGAAGTINGGSVTIASAGWGVVGLALLPVAAAGPATLTRSAAVGATGLIATVGRETLARTAALDAVGAVVSSGVKVTPGVTYERSVALTATGSIATVGRELLPRAAVVTAAGQVQVAGVRIRVIARTAAVSATASIATVGRELLSRSAAVNATGGIATVGRELLARSAAIGATGSIAAAGREQLARLAEFGALARVTASGVVEGPGAVTHSRSAAVAAAATIASAGRETLARAVAVSAAGSIVTAGVKRLQRTATVGATGSVVAAGELEGAQARAAALAATAAITTSHRRVLSRSSTVSATGAVTAASRRDLVRAAVVHAIASIDLTAGGAFGHAELDALATINVSGEKLWAARPPGYIDLPGVGLVTQPIRGSLAGAGVGRVDVTARGRLATASRGAR